MITKIKKISILSVAGLLQLSLVAPSHADEAEGAKLEEELQFLKAETYVVTASKILEKAEKSVATVTVIPERQIRQMGARNLLDILKTVPGLGIGQSASGIRQLEVRGVTSTFSERVLIMLNGHPVDHNLFWGGSMWTYDDLPIDNVKRVEVVRGSGSALYGANAFLATINVITKDAKDVDGAAVAVGGGENNTQQYNALVGKQYGEWHAMANFNYSDTDGANSFIKQDALKQSGRTNLYERRRDLEWKVGYGKAVVLDGRFISKNTGSFVGPSAFLSKDSEFYHDNYFVRLTLEHDFTENFTLTGRAYHDYFEMDQLLEFRKNRFSRFFADSFKTGGELQGTYRFNERNTLIAGFAYESQEQKNVNNQSGASPDSLKQAPLFTENTGRNLWGLYIQDLWDVTDTLRFMGGIRYDKYSDFGETVNPRLGFNWEFLKGYSMRFAYGTAFRAPTFSELFTINNPTVKGNPQLEPEKIDSYEFGLTANWIPQWSTGVIFFRNDITDMIGRVSLRDNNNNLYLRFDNLAGVQTNGIEAFTKYQFSEDSYLSANYTFQDSRFVDTGIRVHDTAPHRGTIQANIALLSHLHWYSEVQVRSSASRPLSSVSPKLNDTRSDAPGYALVNSTLRVVNLHPGLELSLSVFNVFDKHVVTPFSPGVVPNDFPQADRTVFAKIRYEIK